MLSSSLFSTSFQLVKPLLSISNNNKYTYVTGRNSLPSRRRLVCKCSSPPPEIKTKKKLLLRRFSGNTDGFPYFTTLSTTISDTDYNWAITQHNDYISLPFTRTNPYLVDFVGSCDGLMCLEDGNDEGQTAAIWNPSTNDYKILPASSVQRPPSAAYSSVFSLGFGFDPKSQDYKILRSVSFVFETEDGYLDYKEEHLEVYSLKTDSWREVNPPTCVYLTTPITIDGRCYWVAIFYSAPLSSGSDLVLCFDFSTEEFLPPIPLPRAINGTDWLKILECDGSLALLNWNRFKDGEYNVWVLKDRSCWSHVSAISHSSSLGRPIGFVGNDKLFFEGEDSQLLVYDFAARELKSLGIYDEKDAMTIVPFSGHNTPPHYSMGISSSSSLIE